ncbi:TPA: helix-turn-helix transcriptional regulator, partial [Streptococcus pyogenes]|nr:helix-turn-helix transcriptional regulator [Streptococcus pyogenes]HER2539714.1 helix-turn-helix transcriptional regulator [Streptococcus pyogenes]HES4177860.1 helix-turn-helix transcriptional regulator [Streptococcus pyogenes]HES6648111.1 helix-turn-helix transcriptional regulator [Streptococcus pyogenes]HES7873885.1 helix-turn-helix transcriptional regulator [Streptococcus pyogenes]
MNILGNSIKEIRKSKKMTQKELAKLTGFKQNTISNHENGNRQLDEVDIRKYAKALKIEPQQLFDYSSSPTNPQVELIPSTLQKINSTSSQ